MKNGWLSYRWIVVCLGICLGWSLVAPQLALADSPRQGIVVWRLEAKEGVSEKNIDSISGFITAEAEQYSGLKAVSEADIHTILKGEEKRQQCGVDGTSCIAEIGSALGVPEAISGDLGRLGDYWMLNLRRINVRNANVVGRVGKQIKGDINALVEAIPGAVAELFGKVAPEPEPALTQAEPIVQQKSQSGMSTLNKAAFGTFFPGLAFVVLGGIGSWQTQAATDDVNEARFNKLDSSDDESRHDSWQGVAIAGYAIGGAAMITGIALWIADAVGDRQESSPVSLGVMPTKQGVNASLQWQW